MIFHAYPRFRSFALLYTLYIKSYLDHTIHSDCNSYCLMMQKISSLLHFGARALYCACDAPHRMVHHLYCPSYDGWPCAAYIAVFCVCGHLLSDEWYYMLYMYYAVHTEDPCSTFQTYLFFCFLFCSQIICLFTKFLACSAS